MGASRESSVSFNVPFISLNFYTFPFLFDLVPPSPAFQSPSQHYSSFGHLCIFFKTLFHRRLTYFLCISLLYVLLLCILPSWISAAWRNPFSHLFPILCLTFLCSKRLVNLLLVWILPQMLLLFAVPQWRKEGRKWYTSFNCSPWNNKVWLQSQGWFKPFSSPEVKLANIVRKPPPSYFLALNPDKDNSTFSCKPTENSNSAEGQKRKRNQELLVRWKEICKLLQGMRDRHTLIENENTPCFHFKCLFTFYLNWFEPFF